MDNVPTCPLGQTPLVEYESGMWQCPHCGYSEPGSNYAPAEQEWRSEIYDNDDDGYAIA